MKKSMIFITFFGLNPQNKFLIQHRVFQYLHTNMLTCNFKRFSYKDKILILRHWKITCKTKKSHWKMILTFVDWKLIFKLSESAKSAMRYVGVRGSNTFIERCERRWHLHLKNSCGAKGISNGSINGWLTQKNEQKMPKCPLFMGEMGTEQKRQSITSSIYVVH